MTPDVRPYRTVAIVGAGFSGAVTAIQLLRQASGGVRVVLINESGRMARGLAYGTRSQAHVLNVPAGNMSALADDSADFLRYCRWSDPQVQPESFVCRQLYGAYLEALLSAAELKGCPGAELSRVVGRVVAITASVLPAGEDQQIPQALLQLEGGSAICADVVVLAFGHFPPRDPLGQEALEVAGPRYVRDPWRASALAAVGPDDDVLLVGAGLTAVDVALALRRNEHRGHIVSISRRGLAPQSHRRSGVVPSAVDGAALVAAMGPTLRGAFRVLRSETRQRVDRGEDWRDVMGALRAHTPALWRQLSMADRGRFLRHLQPHWDALRHRCAPSAHEEHASLVQSERLESIAARLVHLRKLASGIEVTLRPRGGNALITRRVQTIINCTGPSSDLSRSGSPLIEQLLAEGLISGDEFGLGLRVDDQYRTLSPQGGSTSWLRYIGPLLKAQLWEVTAVPELRVHAQRLAALLLQPHA